MSGKGRALADRLTIDPDEELAPPPRRVEPPAAPEQRRARPEPAAPEPEPAAVPEPAASTAPLGDGARLAELAADAAETARGKKGPPATLRVNEQAGAALWLAYLEAKTADPFLSFRQFTSAVVMQGLGSRGRKRR